MAYEGDMLLQAVHDDVEIALIKDTIEDSVVDPAPRRKIPVRPLAFLFCSSFVLSLFSFSEKQRKRKKS